MVYLYDLNILLFPVKSKQEVEMSALITITPSNRFCSGELFFAASRQSGWRRWLGHVKTSLLQHLKHRASLQRLWTTSTRPLGEDGGVGASEAGNRERGATLVLPFMLMFTGTDSYSCSTMTRKHTHTHVNTHSLKPEHM